MVKKRDHYQGDGLNIIDFLIYIFISHLIGGSI
jgi:hypothetical protein